MCSRNRCKNLLYLAPRFFLVIVFMALVGAMALGNFDLLEPYLFPLHAAQGRITSYGSNITIGHYPQTYELEQLKKERGLDLDISLMSNDLPQEKVLNEQLALRTRKIGIGFKNFPLSYVKLDGAENKGRIEQLVKFLRANSSRKVYIHCYLGRHRVKAVRDELVRQGLIRDPGGAKGV